MTTENAAVATVESIDEAATDQSSLVRVWLDAISIATNEEEPWRKDAQAATNLYRQSSGPSASHSDPHKKFNILHANVETLCPALYNSTPIPDVRRRFNDADPIGKTVADLQERCLQYAVDSYDFDHVMKLAVKDGEIVGRSVDRVRYKPYVGKADKLDYQEVICEHVPWKHFRRGPGLTWDDVPWIAFELFLSRDELKKVSPKLGDKVSLDVSVNKPDDKSNDRDVPEILKRARVWEIWDKDSRKVLFIAESYKVGPIREESDPLELEGFFPIPRPLYAVTTSDSLIPIVPYELYKAQAEELELISERIIALTNAVKAKALYDARITEMDRLEKADDADNIPIENVSIFADGSKLADHVMFYPIDVLTAALEKLYLARDQIKSTIYEITGIADILRGETNPNETLGAQQIKQNWGSLRIQNKQAEIQRYARDIFRIKAELFATKFEPQFLQMMTGIQLMPQPTGNPQADRAAQQQAQAVMQMLRSDKLRGFRVDVESDSTIRADMTRNQQNMSQFLQGTAQFAQAMGPIVMTFKEMTPAVIDVYSAFARNFKLGKQAEDALDKVGQMATQMAQQPAPPDPQQQIEQQKMQMEQQKLQAETQAKQAEMQMKAQESQAKLEADAQANQQKLAFEQQKHEQQMQFEREKHQNDMAMRAHELEQSAQLKQQELAETSGLKREEMMVNSQNSAADRDAKMQDSEANRQHDTAKIEMPIKAESANLEKVLEKFTQRFESAIENLTSPVEIIRGKDGRASGAVRKPVKAH